MIRFFLVTALLLQVAAVGLVVGRNSEMSEQRWCELVREGTVRTNASPVDVNKAIDALLRNHANVVMADGVLTNPTLRVQHKSGRVGPFGDAGVQLVGRVWSQRNRDGNRMVVSTSSDADGCTIIEIESEEVNESVRLSAELCREFSNYDVHPGSPR